MEDDELFVTMSCVRVALESAFVSVYIHRFVCMWDYV